MSKVSVLTVNGTGPGTVQIDPTAAGLSAGTGISVAGGTISAVAPTMLTTTYDAAAIAQQVLGTTATQTVTNKRVEPRLVTVTQAAAPAVDTDNGDVFTITGIAQNITSMTTNLTGTPADGEKMEIRFTDNGTARSITWGTSFASTTVSLPSTTVISTRLRVGFEWDSTASKWACVATA